MQALDIDVARGGRQDRDVPFANAVLHGLTRCDEVPVLPEGGADELALSSWLEMAVRSKWDAQRSFPYGISVRALAPRFFSLSTAGPAPSDNLPTSRHRPILYPVVAHALSKRGGVLG
jgi:hypothetical protein